MLLMSRKSFASRSFQGNFLLSTSRRLTYADLRLCWYVAEKYLRDLKAKEEFSSRVLESLEALSAFLVSEVHIMERGAENGKKEAKDRVPSDRIKDAAAVARELRWRVRLAAHGTSDNEDVFDHKGKVNGKSLSLLRSTNGAKRKRSEDGSGSNDDQKAALKNYSPKIWDACQVSTGKEERIRRKLRKAMDEAKWTDNWMEWTKDDGESGEDEWDVDRRSEVVARVRKTATGIERQRLERTVEVWRWSEPKT